MVDHTKVINHCFGRCFARPPTGYERGGGTGRKHASLYTDVLSYPRWKIFIQVGPADLCLSQRASILLCSGPSLGWGYPPQSQPNTACELGEFYPVFEHLGQSRVLSLPGVGITMPHRNNCSTTYGRKYEERLDIKMISKRCLY